MTYLLFHVYFTLPALLLALVAARNRLRPAHWLCLAAVSVVAFLTTAVWDNWAVHKGIWNFDWERVTPVSIVALNQRWNLPAEEYAFFVLLTLVAGLTSAAFLPKPKARVEGEGEE